MTINCLEECNGAELMAIDSTDDVACNFSGGWCRKNLPLKRMLATQSALSCWLNRFMWWLTKTFIDSDSCSVEMEWMQQRCLLAILFNDKTTGCVWLCVMKGERSTAFVIYWESVWCCRPGWVYQ
jgi:hypothetical protein